MSNFNISKFTSLFTDHNALERIWLMGKMEFKLRYYENKLGLLWALIKPFSQIIMYYLVFQVLMNQRIPNYGVYLFVGLLIWQFFIECTTGTVQILKQKKYLYMYTNINKIEIYISYLLSSFIGLTFNLLVFLVISWSLGIYPSYNYVYFIPITLNLILLSFGVSLILSNLFLLYKDILQIWNIIVGFGFFLSPILYRGEVFSEKLWFLDYLNPISGIINNGRNALLFHEPIDWYILLYDIFYSSIILIIGLFLYNKISPKASELI